MCVEGMKPTLGADGVNVTNTIYTYKNLKKEFSPARLRQLLLQEGYTYRELQSTYKYNERLWSKYAKECNIPKQYCNINKSCTKELPIHQIITMYVDEHRSIRDIANTFNVQHDTITKRLRENNINIRPFNDPYYYNNRRGKSHKSSVDNNGYIIQDGDRQHRHVARKKLHRPLTHTEAVHHIDHDKTNNNPDNLYVFIDNRCHLLYHGQKWTNDPQEFEQYYINVLSKTIYNKSWLIEQYLEQYKSVAQISREMKVSRGVVTKSLYNFGLYDLRDKRVNQFDTNPKKCAF